jgi:hypothetical protein
VEAKFQDCNAFAGAPLSAARVSQVVATALALPNLVSTADLTVLLAPV